MPTDFENARNCLLMDSLREDGTLVLEPRSPNKTLEWLAVLGAADIDYDLDQAGNVWRISIPEAFREDAIKELAEYEDECRSWPPKFEMATGAEGGANGVSLLVTICIFYFFLATGPADFNSSLVLSGQGDAVRISQGEIWRVVTALTLHADLSHLFGNMFGSVFICGALCQSIGGGIGWFAMVVGAAAANLLTSVSHSGQYIYVGLSTAIFLAVGMLGAMQSVRYLRRSGSLGYHFSIPLLAVVAVTAVLGTGPRSDLLGHFSGAFVGLIFGLFGLQIEKYRENSAVQCIAGALAITIVGSAWYFAWAA